MFGASIGRGAMRIINEMVRWLAMGGINPNILTVVGVTINVACGVLFPSRGGEPGLAEKMKPLADGFISLIKMLIAPIIFFTVVGGIASVGDLRKVGPPVAMKMYHVDRHDDGISEVVMQEIELVQQCSGMRHMPVFLDHGRLTCDTHLGPASFTCLAMRWA